MIQSLVQPANMPRAERVGNALLCDKLPYPTHYVKENLTCVVFVPKVQADIDRARHAIALLIKAGRLRENAVRLRMASDGQPYDFQALMDGYLLDTAKGPHR